MMIPWMFTLQLLLDVIQMNLEHNGSMDGPGLEALKGRSHLVNSYKFDSATAHGSLNLRPRGSQAA
jgi:hypothetical protein